MKLKAHLSDERPDLFFVGIKEHVVVEFDIRCRCRSPVCNDRIHGRQLRIVVQSGIHNFFIMKEISPVCDHPTPAVLLKEAVNIGEYFLQLGLDEVHQQPFRRNKKIVAAFSQRGLHGFIICGVHIMVSDAFILPDNGLHGGSHGVNDRGKVKAKVGSPLARQPNPTGSISAGKVYDLTVYPMLDQPVHGLEARLNENCICRGQPPDLLKHLFRYGLVRCLRAE